MQRKNPSFKPSKTSAPQLLTAKILTGGLANFTYCIFTEGQDTKLFAKLSFPYAHFFPDKACPFQELAPGSVATPYHCLDIKGDTEDMKLLLTEWSTTIEQYGNQFIDGAVDPRTAVRLAKCTAALHCSKSVSKDFNQDISAYASTFDDVVKGILDGLASANPAPDRVAALVQEYGADKVGDMFALYRARVMEHDCPVHGDFHTFNIMVGGKPNPETLERFPTDGNVVIGDWEVCHVGPAGRDLGPFQAFPYSCIIAHTINENPMGAQDIFNFLDSMWK